MPATDPRLCPHLHLAAPMGLSTVGTARPETVHESLETLRAVAVHHVLQNQSAVGAYASLSRPHDAAL